MTQRTYKGEVAPDWAEYVVFGPCSGLLYWACDNRRYAPNGVTGTHLDDRHCGAGWRREELDPLPVEVWLVVCAEHPRLLFARSEENAIEHATRLAKANPDST